jgi:hypothetical protein
MPYISNVVGYKLTTVTDTVPGSFRSGYLSQTLSCFGIINPLIFRTTTQFQATEDYLLCSEGKLMVELLIEATKNNLKITQSETEYAATGVHEKSVNRKVVQH